MRPHLNKSIFIKPIKTMINHSSTEIFFENLELIRNVLLEQKVMVLNTY